MWEGFALLVGVKAIGAAAREREARNVVPEPEFLPFRLPSRAARAGAPAVASLAVAPANTAGKPSTLEELGVPRSVASEVEGALRVMGMIEGDRIVGFTYRTPDGVQHPLRASTTPAGVGAPDRAA